ncbi:metallophosphoesterase family protein [Paenibacillus albidus]|uniref:metallophosphoesterase n=1 Tax=Paenibacillus albidus TaxID=2041023 RepID=UPI001BE75C10|nr:metallophosphoesterase [Paenibacillus albidus]MBT2288617.1 metallophosphoesterase family protein [Paenibacillus albidus]
MVIPWLLGIGAVGLLSAGAFGTAMVVNAFRNNIIAQEITLPSLPAAFEGYRILFISDIHRRRLPKALLAPLKGKVDAVFLGGDLTEKQCPLERLMENMELAVSIAPTYAVHGNHDYRADIAKVDRIIRSSGAKLLMDENVPLCKGGETVWLTGVDFPKKGGKTAYAPLPPLEGPAAERGCRIILVHDPLWLSQRLVVPADLILSGHTHGGQVVLPIVGTKKVEKFYHEYNAGMYEWSRGDGSRENAKLMISRGFGTAHLPLRWGSPAEMHVLTLRTGKTSAME